MTEPGHALGAAPRQAAALTPLTCPARQAWAVPEVIASGTWGPADSQGVILSYLRLVGYTSKPFKGSLERNLETWTASCPRGRLGSM